MIAPGQASRLSDGHADAGIAFSAMVARGIFPRGHPAIPFLLLLAIADDAWGLMILALFYPSDPLSFTALTGSLGAIGAS